MKNENKQVVVIDGVKEYLKVLERYGVGHINLRVFTSHPIKNEIFSTDESQFDKVQSFLDKHNLYDVTVNSTFNNLSKEYLKSNRAAKDSDVENIRFLFIDVDPERPSKVSATKEEKQSALTTTTKVKQFLEENGIDSIIEIDSGNGFHLLVPIEKGDVRQVREMNKKFLSLLDAKFSNEEVDIDTSVHNPSRLGKLVGCMAAKGESTEERPHRQSKIISVPSEVKDTSLSCIEAIITENSSEQATVTKLKKPLDKGVKAKAKEWLDYYNLKHKEVDGEIKGMKLFVFDKCPLSEHQNNTNGASLSMNKSGIVKFKCLHGSDEDKTIRDFMKKYPIPLVAQVKAKISTEPVTLVALNAGETFIYDTFTLNIGGVYQNCKDELKKIAEPIFIKEIRIQQEDNATQYLVSYLSNQRWIDKWLSAEYLQTTKFKQLVQYGVDFKSRNEAEVTDYLQMQKRHAKKQYVHNTLGWHVEATGYSYLLDKSYSSSEEKIETYLNDTAIFDFNSKGEFSKWRDVISSEVLGTYMEMGLAIAFAPVVLGYLLRANYQDMALFVVNLQGTTSTGKSTALNMIAGIYGNPNTIVKTLNATQNSLVKLLANNFGVPIILDELGSSPTTDMTSFLYQVSSGEEKLRLNKDGQLKQQESFTTIPIFSSENHLGAYLQNQGGLLARYLEFSEKKWTSSAKSSEKLKKVCNQNYGDPIKLFIKNLLEQGVTIIPELFENSKKELLSIMPEHALKSRISNNTAVMLTSAKLVKSLLEINIDVDYIQQELIQVCQDMLEADHPQSESSFEKVKELIVKNASKFVEPTNASRKPYGASWGTVSMKEEYIQINVFKSEFETQLKREFGTVDISKIIQPLLRKGSMKSEKKRNTKRIRIDKKSVTTYEILLPLNLKYYFNVSESAVNNLSSSITNLSEPNKIESELDF